MQSKFAPQEQNDEENPLKIGSYLMTHYSGGAGGKSNPNVSIPLKSGLISLQRVCWKKRGASSEGFNPLEIGSYLMTKKNNKVIFSYRGGFQSP